MSEEIEVQDSRGNVFADLGLPDAEERLAKATLSILIEQTIQARGWTQEEAAEVLGTTQPKVSDLVRGKLAGFSMEHAVSVHPEPRRNPVRREKRHKERPVGDQDQCDRRRHPQAQAVQLRLPPHQQGRGECFGDGDVARLLPPLPGKNRHHDHHGKDPDATNIIVPPTPVSTPPRCHSGRE